MALALLSIVVVGVFGQAQMGLEWALVGEGAANNVGHAVAFDNDANFFVAGAFHATMVMAYTTVTTSLPVYPTSLQFGELFIARFTSQRQLSWIMQSHVVVGSGSGFSVHNLRTDAYGNAVISGSFNGTSTFSCILGQVTLSAGSMMDGFLMKVNSAGQCINAIQLGLQNDRGIPFIGQVGLDLGLGADNGAVYIAVELYGQGLIAGTAVECNPLSLPYGECCGMVVKITPNLTATVGPWPLYTVPNPIGQPAYNGTHIFPSSVAVDYLNNIVWVAGAIRGCFRFSGAHGPVCTAARGAGYQESAYLSKFTMAGAPIWIDVFSAEHTSRYGVFVDTDLSGHAFLGGAFLNSSQFGTFVLEAPETDEVESFIVRHNGNNVGDIGWAMMAENDFGDDCVAEVHVSPDGTMLLVIGNILGEPSAKRGNQLNITQLTLSQWATSNGDVMYYGQPHPFPVLAGGAQYQPEIASVTQLQQLITVGSYRNSINAPYTVLVSKYAYYPTGIPTSSPIPPTPPPTPPGPEHHVNAAAVAGGIFGGIVGAILIGAFIYWYRTKRMGGGGVHYQIQGDTEAGRTVPSTYTALK